MKIIFCLLLCVSNLNKCGVIARSVTLGFLMIFMNISYADLDPQDVSAMLQANNSSVAGDAAQSLPVNVAPSANAPASTATTVATTGAESGTDPKIAGLAKNYALVVFYESTCPHCQRFTPILKQFSDAYGFKVYAFTVNGQSLPAFPNPLPANPGILQSFFTTGQVEVPAVFLVNEQTMMTYPVSVGEIAMIDLTQRMDEIADSIAGGTQ